MLAGLEFDHQYTRQVEAWNHDLVAQIRRCGRAAGRRLGYKTRTFASDPHDRDDRRIVVWAVVTGSNPHDEDRIHERGELLIQRLSMSSWTDCGHHQAAAYTVNRTRSPLNCRTGCPERRIADAGPLPDRRGFADVSGRALTDLVSPALPL